MGGDAVQTSAREKDVLDDAGDECMAGLTPEQRLDAIEERLRRGATRIVALENNLATNTRLTAEIRELLELGRSGLRILGYIGAIARWAMPIVGLCGVAYGWYQSIRHGIEPPAAK